MKSDVDNIIDTLFYGQIFLDSIENISDKVFFKQKLKYLGKSFIDEMEKTTNKIYSNTDEKEHDNITLIYDVNYKLINKLNNLDIFQKQSLLENFDKIIEQIK